MGKIKGWYYDKQLNSPLTSVTLHANKWWDANAGKFINWDQIGPNNDNGFGSHGGKCDRDKYERLIEIETGACGYGLDPICTSILNEDFNIAISNTWSEFGGDPVGELWNNIRGPWSAVAKPIGDIVNTWIDQNEKYKNSGAQMGWIANMATNAISWAADKKKRYIDNGPLGKLDVVEFLNKALITQGTRFTYYGGTGIAFGNLGMKFTIFPKWENGKFIEAQKQIEKLYPYFIGQIEDFEKATGLNAGNGPVGEMANRCFMFQRPPGGYLTEMLSIDKVQEGTLKLKIGSFYEISNLVCSDVMLNFSKNMVKNPIDQTVSPLFCDVTITLRPSTKYSDIMLKKFVGGSDASKKSIQDIIRKNLGNEKTTIESSVNKPNPTYTIDY